MRRRLGRYALKDGLFALQKASLTAYSQVTSSFQGVNSIEFQHTFQQSFDSTVGHPVILAKLHWKLCWNSIELTPSSTNYRAPERGWKKLLIWPQNFSLESFILRGGGGFPSWLSFYHSVLPQQTSKCFKADPSAVLSFYDFILCSLSLDPLL